MTYWKFRRIRLKNFGHFSEMGMDDFTINRYGSINDIILILGSNSSGKSLLLSHLTPRAIDATNNRKKALIAQDEDGNFKEGLKEVDIEKIDEENNIHIMFYAKILYIDGKTNCSLIMEDMSSGEKIELNPNGNVKPYNEILEKHLGLTKQFVNVGLLGHQTTSLVSMKPAQRYEYISTWLPDIEAYMNGYKAVNKKLFLIKRQVNMINEDIGKLTLDDIMREKGLLENKIKQLSINIENYNGYIIKCDIPLDGLAKIDKKSLKDINNNLNKSTDILNDEKIRIMKVAETSLQYTSKDGQQKLNEDMINHQNGMTNTNNDLTMITTRVDELTIRISELESSLGLVEAAEDSLPDVSKMIDRIEDSLINLNRSSSIYKKENDYLNEIIDELNINNFNIIENLINDINDKYDRITDLVSLDDLIGGLEEYSGLSDKKTSHLTNSLRSVEDDIVTTLDKISRLKNTPLDPDILDLQPKWCDDKTCGVIKEINKLLSPDREVDRLTDILSQYYSKKGQVQSDIDNTSNERNKMAMAINYISDINHNIMRDKLYINFLPPSFASIFAKDINIIFSSLPTMSSTILKIKEFLSIRDQIRVYDIELKNLKNKRNIIKVRYSMNDDLLSCTTEIDSLKLRRIVLTEDASKMIERFDLLSSIKESLGSIQTEIFQYNNLVKSNVESIETYKGLCKDWYFRETLIKTRSAYKLDLEGFKVDIDISRRELSDISGKIASKEKLTEMRDNLLSQAEQFKLLTAAWNPKSGIPSLFINTFLSTLQKTSNIYLEGLWGKNLVIESMELKAREFPITIRKGNGALIPDASVASEGQIAILSLAISMGMMKEAIHPGNYNIFRLDEMDSTLDSVRRRLYIDIIKERMIEIGSRDCFIITHNDEFDLIEADIILLPGSDKNPESMSNKNILLDASDLSIDN